jgi:sterol desaturase/sphingolipid hydroxylase (fatty acid hydroxylase superfamily)
MMDPKSLLTAVLTDASAQVGMLLASLVIFALLGWALFAVSRRKGTVGEDQTFVDYLFPYKRYSKDQLKVDLWMLAASRVFWFPVINGLLLTLLAWDLNKLLVGTFGVRPTVISEPLVSLILQFLISYIAIEFSGYWAHRFLHRQGFLWLTHRAHHSAEVLTFLVGGRGHPLEHIVFLIFGAVCGALATGGFMFLTGTSPHPQLPTLLIGLGLFGAVMDKFLHSQLPISFGPLDYLFMSSRMHQIHHSAETAHHGKNYGGTLSVFDWMFGTAYRPAQDEAFRLGLGEGELGENNPHRTLRALYLEPFVMTRDAWRRGEPLAPEGGASTPKTPADLSQAS